jgi:Rieske Fe-S protein
MNAITRRTALALAGSSAAAVGLAACSPTGTAGSSDSSGSSEAEATPTTDASGQPAIALAEIPVGGSLIVKVDDPSDPAVAVARPKQGAVVAHTAVCTHMQCLVQAAGAELHCPCHGSRYDAFTGEVLNGPATRPLRAWPVTVSGDEVRLGG